ncbi:hypothetical protein [Rhizobium leguminosarum]|uniref:hypothetical protein n=1 Tax=Rhizobium leguminosarum TaxID=384 RepID=UPI00103F7598|nr:hypothetical protein [Rhizobium leguminosarum]TBY40870.1 hypothetical protein E0H54_31780 [Rhizobium leguminosarum bv. viciae]
MAETEKPIDNGGAAFPLHPGVLPGWDGQTGMSLRDWFAGQALVGQLSNSEQVHAGVEPTMSILSGDRRESYAAFLAKEAYVIADAMIAARKAGA